MYWHTRLALGIMTVACLTTFLHADGGSKKLKVLRNINYEAIALWDPANPSQTQTNHASHEPADGSETARLIRPGEIALYTSEQATIAQTDEFGNVLPAGTSSGLVAHIDVIDQDGMTYDAGEDVPVSFFIEDGILKNPGPDTVHCMVIWDASSEQISILPGDGIALNYPDLPSASFAASHQIECKCTDRKSVV